MKTGGWGGPWVALEKPKPPKVDRYLYWIDPPPYAPSGRCTYWLRQFERGWRPNRAISGHCYDCSAEWYGVYMWEYLHVLAPLLDELRRNVTPSA